MMCDIVFVRAQEKGMELFGLIKPHNHNLSLGFGWSVFKKYKHFTIVLVSDTRQLPILFPELLHLRLLNPRLLAGIGAVGCNGA